MKLGVLTCGGDAPGLNAVIRGVVRKATELGNQTIGFQDGWKGVVEGLRMPLDVENCKGLLTEGGTVLGTTRITPFMMDNGVERARETMARNNVDALVVIGGEGSLGCAHSMMKEGFSVVGVPKTIDNDVKGTEMTFGFATAVDIATEAIGRIKTTAESHDRVIVVEVMGRHVGHIATWASIAGGAHMTLIPEEPFDINEVCADLTSRHNNGKYSSIVVVAEGAKPKEGTLEMPKEEVDQFNHVRLGGIGERVANEIAARTGFETRTTVLGYIQRGGSPSAYDRVLATSYGVEAAAAVHEGDFGKMVAFNCGKINRVPLEVVTEGLKYVEPGTYQVAKTFFA